MKSKYSTTIAIPVRLLNYGIRIDPIIAAVIIPYHAYRKPRELSIDGEILPITDGTEPAWPYTTLGINILLTWQTFYKLDSHLNYEYQKIPDACPSYDAGGVVRVYYNWLVTTKENAWKDLVRSLIVFEYCKYISARKTQVSNLCKYE